MDSPNPRKHSAQPLLRQAKQVKINNGTSYHITSDLCVDAFVMHGEMNGVNTVNMYNRLGIAFLEIGNVEN